MQYKLRLIANNVVGASQPSESTKEFQTIQASPSHPPKNVTVRAMNATELRVRWIVSIYYMQYVTFVSIITEKILYQDIRITHIIFCTAVAANRMERKSTRVQHYVY